MKKIFLLFVALLFVVACNLPFFPFGSSPTETPNVIVVTATPQSPEVPAASPQPEETAATPGSGQTLPQLSLVSSCSLNTMRRTSGVPFGIASSLARTSRNSSMAASVSRTDPSNRPNKLS